jgi:hypothetical protein
MVMGSEITHAAAAVNGTPSVRPMCKPVRN